MDSSKQNDWATGLCDCFSDVPSCCLTLWCPCIAFGRVAEIVNEGSPSCCATATIYTLLGTFIGCSWIYSCGHRTKLREQYGLKKTPCNDCMVHACCGPLALCQEYRELQTRGFDVSSGWTGNVGSKADGVVRAPVMEGGMKY